MNQSSIGLDFGTTNTVLSRSAGDGSIAPLLFGQGQNATSTFPSALCFWEENEERETRLRVAAGPWAIEHFLIDPQDCRFLQSLKSFAASRLFEGTAIFEYYFRFEELLGAFFDELHAHAGQQMQQEVPRLVVGRPVQYVGANPDADLAMRRYRDALASIGFNDVFFAYEPVAAAFFYARRLQRDATVLVADFGGGTTDYSVMHFEVGTPTRGTPTRGTPIQRKSADDQSASTTGGDAVRSIRAHALAHAGAGVAGDRFDYRIIDKVVSPLLGKGSEFNSMGKILEMPNSCYSNFASWHLLSVLPTSREFREFKELVTWAKQPELVKRMVGLVESGRSYSLYQAVSSAKARLSTDEQTTLRFETSEVSIAAPIKRADFEHWIADDLEVIEKALDEALRRANLKPEQISKVFLTGGTSFVPAVRRLFEQRFGKDKLESGDEFESIANGLALIGERSDIENWVLPA